MAEETKFKIWHVIQSVIGSLLCIGIVSLSSNISQLNSTVLRHDILIEQLLSFRQEGNRYTAADGEVEEASRIGEDIRLSNRIDRINKILNTGISREHDKLLLMEQKVNALDHSVKKMWSVLNEKLKIDEAHTR